jgi:hypothetical protein
LYLITLRHQAALPAYVEHTLPPDTDDARRNSNRNGILRDFAANNGVCADYRTWLDAGPSQHSHPASDP